MDIQVFDITFASFLKAFRKSYKLSDNSYDYMAFLNDVDCASYCSMMATYKNPNEILNTILTPSLNNIQIISGGKKKMKGGGKHQLLLIALMYILSVSSVFAGRLHDTFINKYGNDPKAWPKKPENAPSEPENRWNGFFITIGPSASAIEAYNSAKAQFDKDVKNYETFTIDYGRAIEEVEKETETKLTEAKTDLTEAETDKIKAKTIKDMTDFAQAQMLTTAELQRKLGAAEGKAEANLWKGIAAGILVGGGSVMGLIFYYINRMFNTRLERLENGTYVARRPDIEIFDVDQGQGQRRQITNGVERLQITNGQANAPNQLRQRQIAYNNYGGKKTKKHRKRTNRRK